MKPICKFLIISLWLVWTSLSRGANLDVDQATAKTAAQATAQTTTNSLGRLLLTPEQRQELEESRRQQLHKQPGEAARLDGVIRRSDGKNFTWLNGKLQTQSNEGDLKVGQTLYRRSKVKRDLLDDESVR